MNVIRRITSKKSENSERMHSEQQRRKCAGWSISWRSHKIQFVIGHFMAPFRNNKLIHGKERRLPPFRNVKQKKKKKKKKKKM